jgi:hypothetical protein
VTPGDALTLESKGQWRGSIMGSRLSVELASDGTSVQAAPVPAVQQASPPPAPDELPQQGVQQQPANPDEVPGRHMIRLELADVATTPVVWKVMLEVVTPNGQPPPSGQPVSFHAWLERDDEGPSGLTRNGQPPLPVDAADRPCTLGTLSCGRDAIVVGGYSTALGFLGAWELSGNGPSRRGDIQKPDLSAPAHYVTLIRSARGNGLPDTLARVTGTSVAAPFVTGTIACIYERDPDATLAKVRNALRQSAQPLPGQAPGWTPDLGHGRLNPAGVLALFP